MKKLILFVPLVVTSIAVAGYKEKVHSKDYYKKHITEGKEVLKRCLPKLLRGEKPSQNCKNADRAQSEVSFGKKRHYSWGKKKDVEYWNKNLKERRKIIPSCIRKANKRVYGSLGPSICDNVLLSSKYLEKHPKKKLAFLKRCKKYEPFRSSFPKSCKRT